jgi:hypothetical protein
MIVSTDRQMAQAINQIEALLSQITDLIDDVAAGEHPGALEISERLEKELGMMISPAEIAWEHLRKPDRWEIHDLRLVAVRRRQRTT